MTFIRLEKERCYVIYDESVIQIGMLSKSRKDLNGPSAVIPPLKNIPIMEELITMIVAMASRYTITVAMASQYIMTVAMATQYIITLKFGETVSVEFKTIAEESNQRFSFEVSDSSLKSASGSSQQ